MKQNQFSPGEIILYPGSKIIRSFKYNPAASATERGSIPYGTNIASVVVTAYDSDKTDVTSLLIFGTPVPDNNVVTITFQYPGTDGQYTLKIDATLDDGIQVDIREWDLIFAYS